MNKERILALADSIEQSGAQTAPEIGFNMNFFSVPTNEFDKDYAERDCGTVACIAGHAVALGRLSGGFGAAAKWLGLEYPSDIAAELFFPGDASGIRVARWNKITPAHAVAVLRRLVETGKVDWTAVLPTDRQAE